MALCGRPRRDPHRARRRPRAGRPTVLRSETRILTTHAGSLPRPRSLAELHGKRSRGEEVDAGELQREVSDATAAVVAAQLEAGIDIGNDGEQARESFVTYVQHRMTGFAGTGQRPLMQDLLDHPDFLDLVVPRHLRRQVNLMAAPAAVGGGPLPRHEPRSMPSARSWPGPGSPRRS